VILVLLSFLLEGEALVLRERATAESRFVRLLEVVDASRLDEPGRARLRDVFLGRAPAAGERRVVTAEEIRRELAWRGLSIAVSGAEVEVRAPGRPAPRPSKAGVARGDVVRALGDAYEADARALEAGAPGATIPIEFLATKTRARARVAAEGRVEVSP